jgi:hypothetical protein
MQTRTRAAVFATLGFVAVAVAGEGTKTYDIDWHERWTVRQAVTYTVREKSDMETTMGGNTLQAEHTVLDAVYVVRCDECDDKGDPTKRSVFVKSWNKTKKNDTPNESLAGETVVVTGKEWRLASGKLAGIDARKWLDSTFGKKDSGNPLEEIAPKQLTVGEPWKADPKVVAAAFSKAMDGAPFDASGVTMEMLLTSVEGTPPDASGKFTFKVHLPISKLPNMPPRATLHEGSGAEAGGTRNGPLSKSTMLETVHMDIDMKVDIDIPTPNGTVTTSTVGKVVQDKSAVAGGEIPEPKAPAPPAGDK